VDVLTAIHERRAVRSYTDKKLDRATVMKLLEAAVQAPSAHNTQPWAFAVVQDGSLLRAWSTRAKAHELRTAKHEEHIRELLKQPEFDLFHRAGTLIVIYARGSGPQAAEDCALAAQNLMLAAHALELGTCPIGLARGFLNSPDARRELGVPEGFTAAFPLVVGTPRIDTAPTPRDDPRILAWRG
jgi:nitroreductase